ncbi:hypothetical protein HYU19_06115 [Candidatus Woesearchaeota archaeon]|nr:hypothetical protein [Candidatus Woesearchaeota archaeon]
MNSKYHVLLLAIFLIAVIFIIGQEQTITSRQRTLETGKMIKAPDTGNILFVLNGTEIVDGDCSTAKSFDEWEVALPKDCEGVVSLNVADYCELGNKKGENVNNYYCRPVRVMKCKIVSPSGEVKDVKYYGITKVLKCENTKEQLIDIQVKSCKKDDFGLDCS